MKDNRLILRVVMKIMALVGVGFLLYVLFSGLFVSQQPVNSVGLIELSGIAPGSVSYYQLERRRLLVLWRDADQLNAISGHDAQLYDSGSAGNMPAGLDKTYRSYLPEYFVAYAYDPYYGCDIRFNQQVQRFQAVCANVEYDLAGRVYKGSAVQQNLIVPDYEINNQHQLLLQRR